MSERSDDFIRGVKHVLDNAFERYRGSVTGIPIYRPSHKEYRLPDDMQRRVDEIAKADKEQNQIKEAREFLESKGYKVEEPYICVECMTTDNADGDCRICGEPLTPN